MISSVVYVMDKIIFLYGYTLIKADLFSHNYKICPSVKVIKLNFLFFW